MSYGAQAYARTSQTTATPREVEAQALLKAARQLREIQTNWTGHDQNLHKALMFNRRLDTRVAAGRTIQSTLRYWLTIGKTPNWRAPDSQRPVCASELLSFLSLVLQPLYVPDLVGLSAAWRIDQHRCSLALTDQCPSDR
jgi:hypothetical protein